MKRIKYFFSAQFIFILVIILALMFFSFSAAFAKDDGNLSENIFLNFLADLFSVFRFPTLVLLNDYISSTIFFCGLFLNAILYSIVIDRTIEFISKKIK